MEELFINKTKYTEQEYETFLKHYDEEYATSENLYMIYYIAFFGLCLILSFINVIDISP